MSRRPTIDALEPRQHLSRNQVVGYLPNYFYDATIDVEKVDWSALTQVDYFAAIPTTDGQINLPAADQTRLDEVVRIAHAHGVKVSLVLGGAGQDGSLQEILGNDAAHATLAAELIEVQATHKIDGVDIDWEPLTPTKTQVTNYGRLIRTVQQQTSMIVSAAVNPEKLPVSGGAAGGEYVLDTLALQHLDQIGVMAYDLDYAYHSEFARSTRDLTDWAAYLTANGQSKEKLLFGLPFYGRAGTSWGNSTTQSYRDLVNRSIAEGDGLPGPNVDNLNVAFPGSFGGAPVEWYFNGKTAINAKTGFALDSQVGGVMIWDIAQDHTDAQLDYTNYSLLPGVRTTVNARGTLEMTPAQSAYVPDGGLTRFVFNQVIDTSTAAKADLVLTNLTTGQRLDATQVVKQVVNEGGAAVYVLDMPRLADGNYRATLRAGSVRTPTGDVLRADASLEFHVLAGDANRDRTVNFADLLTLASNYNQTNRSNSQGDANYDRKVDFADLLALASNYNRTLPTSGALIAGQPMTAMPTFGETPIGEKKHTRGRLATDLLA